MFSLGSSYMKNKKKKLLFHIKKLQQAGPTYSEPPPIWKQRIIESRNLFLYPKVPIEVDCGPISYLLGAPKIASNQIPRFILNNCSSISIPLKTPKPSLLHKAVSADSHTNTHHGQSSLYLFRDPPATERPRSGPSSEQAVPVDGF